MQQNLLEEYTDFVDKVTSEASKSSGLAEVVTSKLPTDPFL